MATKAKNSVRVSIHEGVLKGRRPPSSIGSRLSNEEWLDLSYAIYEAVLPAIKFKQIVFGILLGVLVMPFLAFVCLLIFILTGLVQLEQTSSSSSSSQTQYDDDFNYDNDGSSSSSNPTTTTEEQAFEFLLVVGAIGCVSLIFLTLILASAIRCFYIETFMEASFEDITCDFEDRLLDDNKNNKALSISIKPPLTSNYWVRRALLAWCDVDFVMVLKTNSQDSLLQVVNENYSLMMAGEDSTSCFSDSSV